MARRRKRARGLRTTDDMIREFRRLHDEALPVMADFMFKEAWRVLDKSQDIVLQEAFDEGDLLASGKVLKPEIGRGYINVDVQYGNENVPYAIVVHERQGGVKYLTDPFKKNRRRMADRLMKHLRRQLL